MQKRAVFFPSAVTLAAITLATFSTIANAGQSIWNHNGSQMLLESNGNQRTISYLKPRHGISARPGQILFQGRRVGNRYEGTAYTFRRGCPPAPYRVSGQLGSETRIVLYGASPRRQGCQVIGYSSTSGNARLVFSYLRKSYGAEANEPPAIDPLPQEGPVEGPLETIIKRIPGGKIIFTVQDQDAPAETPIRIDATALCNDGRQIEVLKNHRTCQLLGIRSMPGGNGYVLNQLSFGGSSCSLSNVKPVPTSNMCQ